MNIPDFAASLVTFFCVPEESSLKGKKKKNSGRWDALGYCKVASKTVLFRYSNIILDFVFETTYELRFALHVCKKVRERSCKRNLLHQ